MLQKLHMSADLKIPGPAPIDPSEKQPTGEANHFEVFKVSWQSKAKRPGDSRPSSAKSRGSHATESNS